MARSRPVALSKSFAHQSRPNFSGSHNDLSRLDQHLITQARSAFALLTANAVTFPSPPVDLATMGGLITEYQAAKQAMGLKGTRGGKIQMANLLVQRQAMTECLVANSQYAATVARGLLPTNPLVLAIATMVTSGFAQKHKSNSPFSRHTLQSAYRLRIKLVPTPLNLHNVIVKGMATGDINLQWQRIRNAKAYQIFDALAIGGPAMIATTTKTRYVANIGTNTAKSYFVRAVSGSAVSGNSQTITLFGLAASK